jgi:hypothetical protein
MSKAKKMEKVKLNILKENPDNPRYIKDSKFKKLVKSIKEFPEMLQKRPIVVDEDYMVLGGNMRLKACQKAGLDEVYISMAKGWSDEKKKEFIIKDNIGYGEWEWDVLANEWELSALEEWGLDIPNLKLDAEFEEEPEIEITQEVLEEHNYIVFTFDNSLDWQVAKELLDIKTVAKDGYTDTYMQKGIGRVKKGKDLLKLLNGL